MNESRKKIEELQSKINPLKEKIYEIENEEIMKVQLPRLTKMIGYCMRNKYEKLNYGRIIDLVNNKEGTPVFILELCSLSSKVNPYLHLDNVYPYTNKEWWDAEIPMSGWEKCTEEEYQLFKAKVMSEFASQKLLRKSIIK